MTYEPVSYDAGGVTYEQAAGSWYVNANLTMYPAGQVLGNGTTNMGNFIAWDAGEGKIVWSIPERWSVWSGVLTTAGDVAFYGTLEGYAKAVDANSQASCCGSSRPRPALSATSTPGPTRANSTSVCSPASADGPARLWLSRSCVTCPAMRPSALSAAIGHCGIQHVTVAC